MSIRNSQDVSLALTQSTASGRISQDVLLVLSRPLMTGTVADAQATQSLDVSAEVVDVISTAQASQTSAVSGAQLIHIRDSQDVTLAIGQTKGTRRLSQDVLLVVAPNIEVGAISNVQAAQSLSVVATVTNPGGTVSDTQAAQSLDVVATVTNPPRPPAQPVSLFRPVLKPLDFPVRPILQAGRRRSVFSVLLTEEGASRAFSMPLGARNQPIAGKVFSFTMGGMLHILAGGSVTITPIYGATSRGVNLGQSVPQVYSPSVRALPWRLKGEIIFKSVDLEPGASLAVCTGVFAMNDIAVMFGSATPILVNASAVMANASGALNFAVTFAPSALNASRPTISAKYAFLRAI